MEKRKKKVIVFMSFEEMNALARLQELEGGLNKSAMIRRLIRIEAKKKSLWAIDDRTADAANAKSALFG